MFFLVVLIEAIFIHSQQKTITTYMIKEGRTMAALLADSVRLGVFSANMEMVAAPVAAILKQGKVVQVLVFDKNGEILLDKRRGGAGDRQLCDGILKSSLDKFFPDRQEPESVIHQEGNDCLLFMAPVLASSSAGGEELFFDIEADGSGDKDFLGFVSVAFNRQILEKKLYQLLLGNILLGALCFLLAAVVTYMIVRTVSRPFNQLVQLVRKNETGSEKKDEIDLLRESFSSMVDQLTTSFTTINRLKGELEEMTREVLRTQEQERQRLAFDLHDNVAQELSALKIFCGGLLKEYSTAPKPAIVRLEFIAESLKKCIETVRELSYDLRPPGLTQLGLAQTVAQLCEQFGEASGVQVDFQISGLDEVEPEYNVAINCYRIIQEALSNVKKHAKAKTVQVRLIASFPKIIVRIRDNGVGFDVAARSTEVVAERRMGLRNMEKRATLLDGMMTIESFPGKGTLIIVALPYELADEIRSAKEIVGDDRAIDFQSPLR